MREMKPGEPVYVLVQQDTETRRCDKCGEEISLNWPEGMCAHELLIVLDQDACVNLWRKRDYCPACLAPLWAEVNRLIGTTGDPWAEREEGRGEW